MGAHHAIEVVAVEIMTDNVQSDQIVSSRKIHGQFD